MDLTNFKRTPVLIALIVALTFAAYSFALQGNFKTMDDQISIVRNSDIRSFSNIGKILVGSFFGDKTYHRPMITLSFMLEYHFWGLNALFYYLTNIFLHSINAILVFFLMRRLWGQVMPAFWVALLFAVHPVQWEAVSNIPGRSNLLCAFFYLSVFLIWMRLLTDQLKRPQAYSIYFLSLVLFVMAILSKELAGVLPGLMLFYIFLFRSTLRQSLMNSLALLSGYCVIEGAYIIFRKVVGITEVFQWQSAPAMFLGFMTFLRGVLTYFRLFFFPVDLQFDRASKIFTHTLDPEVLLTLLVFFVFFFIILSNRRRISAIVLFFIAWFFIDLLPVCQLFASIGVQPGYISIAEHFLYTPSIPFLALVVLGLQWLYNQSRERDIVSAPIFKVGITGLFLFYYLLTIQHNLYSSNEMAMFERTLVIYPDNVRIRNSLADAYGQLGLYKEAEKHYRKSLAVYPGSAFARIGLGKTLCDQGRYWEGIKEYEMVYDAGRFKDLLEENLRLTYAFLAHQYETALLRNPQNADNHYGLGIVYSKTDRVPQAIKEFEETVKLKSDFQYAWFNLSSAYEANGQLQEAAQSYEHFLTLGIPPEAELLTYAFSHLGQIYEKLADSEKAEKYNSLAAQQARKPQ